MARIICIYKITNPKGKIYIGQTRNYDFRIYIYKKLKCEAQIKLFRSLKKYGFDKHFFEILELCDIKDLNKKERYWQDYYNSSSKKGLNCVLTPTKDKAYVVSEQTRDKMRRSQLGKKMSEETKIKIGKASTLRRGWTVSEETKEKLRKANLGRKHSKERIYKMINSRTGKKLNNTTKEKLRKSWDIKTRDKKTYILNTETGIFYLSAKKASESTNIKTSTLYGYLMGKRKNKSYFKYV